MATKKKGAKSAKKLEDIAANEDIETNVEKQEIGDTPEGDNSTETIMEQTPDASKSSPEPVYDEPTLAELIIESFEGEKVKGLYEGEGEACFTGGHCYKGHFSEGLMHGIGVYVWADGVIYEGDFVQNQITGKGKYQWEDGSLYEGEVLEGKRHGMGMFRCKDNQMSYSGQWWNGKRHGKGRMDYDSEGKSFFDGDWVNNVRHGWGTRQYPTGNMYQGMWFNNVRHGEGTMKWLDRDQIYTGQWENGIQHGMGQHIWLLRRIITSQYPLRNMYDGEFMNGLRHGYGSFCYANGARYDGFWKNNMKHGKGKFTFKNGRIYEGMFEKDHIVEYPEFTMDGMATPDLSNIRTRTPLPEDNLSVHSNDSRNTMGPTFQLEIDNLLNEFPESDRAEEVQQVMFVIMRHMTSLKTIYNYYSHLGFEESPDNTYVMNRMQFWRLLLDCKMHHQELTIMDMDRLLGHNKAPYELHSPYERILQRQFINYLTILSYYIYHEQHEGTTPVLVWCMSKMISDNILPNACNVQGNFYFETRRAVNALVHHDQAYEVYQTFADARKYPPKEQVIKMRKFLYMLKDLRLVNNDLTASSIIEILASDNPAVSDGEGCYNLELEMTFLEFFEALVGCAQVFVTESVVKDPTTPRPSTIMTQDPSLFSVPASPSRVTSQAADETVESIIQGSARHGAVTPDAATSARHGSSDGNKTINTKDETHGASAVSETARTAAHGSQGDLTTIGEHGKSMSFISTHTGTEEPQGLMQSSVSFGDLQGDNVEDEQDGDVEDDEQLDEATRQFNFWTHQIHIFFVRKFFPVAEKATELKHKITKDALEEAKRRANEV